MKTKQVEMPAIHYSKLIAETMDQLNKKSRKETENKSKAVCKMAQKRIALVKTKLAKASQTLCTLLKVDVVARYIQKNALWSQFILFPKFGVPINTNQRYIVIFWKGFESERKSGKVPAIQICMTNTNGTDLWPVCKEEFGLTNKVPDSLLKELERLQNPDALAKRIAQALYVSE